MGTHLLCLLPTQNKGKDGKGMERKWKIGNSRLIYPMTLWEYSSRPCWVTYQTEKRHSRSYAVSRKQSYAVL